MQNGPILRVASWLRRKIREIWAHNFGFVGRLEWVTVFRKFRCRCNPVTYVKSVILTFVHSHVQMVCTCCVCLKWQFCQCQMWFHAIDQAHWKSHHTLPHSEEHLMPSLHMSSCRDVPLTYLQLYSLYAPSYLCLRLQNVWRKILSQTVILHHLTFFLSL